MEPNFRPASVFANSEPIALAQKTIAPVTLPLKITEGIAIPEAVAVVTVVGVGFCRNVNGELLELKDAGGMRVLWVG
jgi:hypothetical protein